MRKLLLAATVLLYCIQGNVAAKQKTCGDQDDCDEAGFFCFEGKCRKSPCTVSSQCEEDEICKYTNVNGKKKTACVPYDEANQNILNKIIDSDRFCTGGGRAVFNFDLKLATCDHKQGCPEGAVCNPLYGVCCTKLKTCPLPSKTQMNAKTGRPIMCQLKGGMKLQCPRGGYCELQTGFCCTSVTEEEKRKVKENKEKEKVVNPDEEEGEERGGSIGDLIEKEKAKGREISRPWRGSSCQPSIGCSGSAACICTSKHSCRCECAAEFGYTVASDGKTCQRIRRRLKERCKSDMECSAAFSECATGGCRCKRGFQRDGDGGCKPINYQCVNRQPPLVQDNAVVTCNLRMAGKHRVSRDADASFEEYYHDVNSTMAEGNERDDCPEGHYCVPVFDNAGKKGYYQGFCCPSPTEVVPVCPVGMAHDSSAYPDFGCKECPGDHYCHRDSISTDKEICCPKPCPSLEDIYLDGQCLTVSYYGDSCTVSAQCTYHKESMKEDEFTTLTQMECAQNICQCPAGYTFSEGHCIRVMCTVGLRGEPMVDRFNNLIRCDRSGDCAQGHMCDPNTKVCCKGINRCPKDYVETGALCNEDNCMGSTEICHRTSKGKAKICCKLEDASEYSHVEEKVEEEEEEAEGMSETRRR
ncbi:hypothetical protein PRIPAC_76647 [Pristionchus pacificus]|nr:hypothetical protein PRIPAC_76647 [Pristionchus pacificus]